MSSSAAQDTLTAPVQEKVEQIRRMLATPRRTRR